MCWSHGCALQKQLNRSRFRLRTDSTYSSGPKEPCIRRDQDWTNPFAAAKVDKSAMRPFAKLLWTISRILVLLCFACILFRFCFFLIFATIWALCFDVNKNGPGNIMKAQCWLGANVLIVQCCRIIWQTGRLLPISVKGPHKMY